MEYVLENTYETKGPRALAIARQMTHDREEKERTFQSDSDSDLEEIMLKLQKIKVLMQK